VVNLGKQVDILCLSPFMKLALLLHPITPPKRCFRLLSQVAEVEALKEELVQRPTSKQVDDLRKQVKILQAVGYNSIEAEDWELATRGDDIGKLETLLLDKNRRLEHELTQAKVGRFSLVLSEVCSVGWYVAREDGMRKRETLLLDKDRWLKHEFLLELENERARVHYRARLYSRTRVHSRVRVHSCRGGVLCTFSGVESLCTCFAYYSKGAAFCVVFFR
jgi:hypothetical protein